ncbi:unnamed protein product [Spodoptera exigua]|nr:unnamed protein product [Spodoptera exigua]
MGRLDRSDTTPSQKTVVKQRKVGKRADGLPDGKHSAPPMDTSKNRGVTTFYSDNLHLPKHPASLAHSPLTNSFHHPSIRIRITTLATQARGGRPIPRHRSRRLANKGKPEDIIPNAKVMILQEVNEPILTLAVSKAATLLGAADVGIIDSMQWEHDYHGRIFSDMADIIFLSTNTHMCAQRFADRSSVPVLCLKSRTHACLQALASIMAIMEEFGTMQGINLSYVGPPHPVLNSYLLLCPMLGANIRFKCCCKICPVTPLFYDTSRAMTASTATETQQCADTAEAVRNACVVIAGPTTEKKEKLPEFTLSVMDINRQTCFRWIFLHTCPRGDEVDDLLFWNENSRTFTAFQNMHYIAAALMANHCRDYRF